MRMVSAPFYHSELLNFAVVTFASFFKIKIKRRAGLMEGILYSPDISFTLFSLFLSQYVILYQPTTPELSFENIFQYSLYH